MKKLLFLAALLVVFSSCTKYGDTSFRWLEGRWEQQSASDTITEVWEKMKKGQYQGMGSETRGGKIVFSEKLALERKEGTLYYVATVEGQNNGQPVYFKYSGGMNDVHIFENRQHDFPQRIIYHFKPHKAQDSLYAVVEGMVNGKMIKEEYKYGRVE
jgi:hypothetical protein